MSVLDLITPNTGKLDGQALAALCTTGRENLAAVLGCHTSTETMGLGALALVRLISTFHWYPFRILKSNCEIISDSHTL